MSLSLEINVHTNVVTRLSPIMNIYRVIYYSKRSVLERTTRFTKCKEMKECVCVLLIASIKDSCVFVVVIQ
jgi:hypothetical protein